MAGMDELFQTQKNKYLFMPQSQLIFSSKSGLWRNFVDLLAGLG